MSDIPNIDYGEVIKLAQNMSAHQEKTNPLLLTPIDQLVNNQEMRVLKATLPYMDLPKQKNFALLVKILELKKTMSIYQAELPLHNALEPKKNVDRLELLNVIKNNCDEPQQKKINSLIMMMNFQNTLANYRSNPKLLPGAPLEQPDTQQSTPTNDASSVNNGYDQFMNMMNKIIKEKGGE